MRHTHPRTRSSDAELQISRCRRDEAVQRNNGRKRLVSSIGGHEGLHVRDYYRQPAIMTIMAATVPADVPEPLTTLNFSTYTTDAIARCLGRQLLAVLDGTQEGITEPRLGA